MKGPEENERTILLAVMGFTFGFALAWILSATHYM